MNWPETVKVVAALQAEGTSVRFVGGCVRDALLDTPANDIDIATPDEPETVVRLLEGAGVHAIPTGIDHGTITAVCNKRHFEITTLRLDVEAFGRRARVAFTDDWVEDAKRRDFTINALYADPDGNLFDPTGGLADLKAGVVRFVGDAVTRIREDRLRVLRFFRFFARFGKGEPDAAALAACRAEADGLEILSGERVRSEFLRLLETGHPAPVIRLMAENGILAHILPDATRLDRLEALLEVDREVDGLRRLAALLDGGEAAALAVAGRLKLSGKERRRLVAMLAPEALLQPDMTDRDLRRALYLHGLGRVRDWLLMGWAEAPSNGAFAICLDRAESMEIPAFPLKGADVLALGVAPGPRVGKLLRRVEGWWINEDFRQGREALLAKLKEIVPQEAGP